MQTSLTFYIQLFCVENEVLTTCIRKKFCTTARRMFHNQLTTLFTFLVHILHTSDNSLLCPHKLYWTRASLYVKMATKDYKFVNKDGATF